MKQIVYVSSPESQQIHVWNLSSKGSLTLSQIVSSSGRVQPMMVNPNKRFMYVGIRPKPRVVTYRITSEDGTLTWVAEMPLPGNPTHISADHQGKFLFIVSYDSNCISVIRLENGIPRTIVDKVNGIEGCHFVGVSPNDFTLWVTALKQNRIYLFSLSDQGKLMAKIPSEIKTTKGAGPRHIVFHPNKQYAYVVNELLSSVDVWKLKSKEIVCIQTLDMMPKNFSGTRWGADIHIVPNGRYLYTCDRTTNLITIFSISEDGSITVEGFQPTETQPRSFNIDKDGKYLISAGQKSHHITLYNIQSNKRGLLKEKGRYPVGKGPMWVLINSH